jgi:hypothetical protein
MLPFYLFLLYNHKDMDERRFYQKPGFYIFSWILVGGGFYIWQIWKMGGLLQLITTRPFLLIVDAFIFGLGLLLWLAFFAQFVLPVKTFKERQQIFDRLMAHLSNSHGPAIFVENGRTRESHGERLKKGPGVLWLDSASAVVTRSATKFENTFGPGVHFTKRGESIASTVDLHSQVQGLGPREFEDSFAPKKEEQSDEEFKQIQKRRLEVSAWTRDGIEVVPNISVVFKIDSTPTKEDEEGSRFGFDEESVRKAITGEGINPGAPSDAPRHRVAWNQLPALIAADLWREYLSKFTLAELFEVSQPGSRPKPPVPAPEPDKTHAVLEPITPSSGIEKAILGMLREMNSALARWADKCEGLGTKPAKSATPPPKPPKDEPKEPKLETALETINRMIKARMTEAEVDIMDENGKVGTGTLESPEYELLKRRGLKVLAAGVGNLRFPQHIEDQLVYQWSTTWLDNANAEREQIDRQRGFVELSGQVDAARKYALSLSSDLLRHKPRTAKDTLKTLMLRSRDELVKDDRLHRRASMEREELEGLIQWLERNNL